MITLVVMHPTKINARKKFKSRLVNTNQGDFFLTENSIFPGQSISGPADVIRL